MSPHHVVNGLVAGPRYQLTEKPGSKGPGLPASVTVATGLNGLGLTPSIADLARTGPASGTEAQGALPTLRHTTR